MKAATIVQAHARRILATKKVKKMGSGGMGLGHFANLDSQKKQKLKRDNDAEQAMGKKLGVILIRETESAQLRAALATLDAAPSVGNAKRQAAKVAGIVSPTGAAEPGKAAVEKPVDEASQKGKKSEKLA